MSNVTSRLVEFGNYLVSRFQAKYKSDNRLADSSPVEWDYESLKEGVLERVESGRSAQEYIRKKLVQASGDGNSVVDKFVYDVGDYQRLSREIFIIGVLLKIDFFPDTPENFEIFSKFYRNAREYSNGSISDFWLLDEISRLELEDLMKNNLSFILNLLRHSVLKLEILDNERSATEKPLLLIKDQNSKILSEIFKIISEDRLGELVNDNDVIEYIINNNFSFQDFNSKMSSFVNDILSDKSGVGFEFQIDRWVYDRYLNLQTTEDFSYRLTNELYPSGNPKIVKSPTESQVQVVINGVEDLSQAQGFSQNASSVLWPDVATTNLSGDIIPEALEAIESLDDFESGDLSQYPFQFYIKTTPDYSFLTNPIEAFAELFDGGETATQFIIDQFLKEAYAKIIINIFEELQDNSLDRTVGRIFNNYYESNDGQILIEKIATFILTDKEIVRRKAFWDSLADAEEDDGKIDPEEEAEALSKALDAWKSGKPPKLKDELSKEDIANRQKFFKQCALMMNMSTLKGKYNEILRDRYENGKLFDDRFYMAYCAKGGQEKLLSNLLTSADEQALMEIPGHVLSSLVPKVRLYKVTEQGDRVENTEFIFNATADNSLDRKQGATFLSEDFDKGNGCGLKEFSFEFNGTNPAEARNDIKATLKLYFQSFSDFIRERKASNGKTYKYVDLIIQPTPDKKQKINGIEVISDRQYEPSFYRIRADVGYYLDNIQDEEIRKAIEVSNKSLFLNMVDHDIQFKNDGSVEISISYRAYLESLLKHPRLDALASPELIKKRQENARLLARELSKQQCSKDQIQELQVSIAATEDSILKRSLSSIIDRLRSRGVIYTAQITEEDRNQFLTDGFFKKCRLRSDIVVPKLDQNCTFQGDKNKADVGVVLNTTLPENAEDFNFLNSANGIVQFFFFGDLLYTILDCVYKDGSKLRSNSGFQNSKILLGSFEFDPFQLTGVGDRVYNIAHIPISVDFFSRWFVEEVMAQKSTRKTFPVLNFVRNLTNQLIKPSLLENCVNRSVDKTLRFQTSQITAYHDKSKGVDPLNKFNKPEEKVIGMEVMSLRDKKSLPLKGGGASDDPNNLFNYIVLSTAGSSLSFSGKGKYKEDIEQGRLHVNIGQNNGLVKSISLSKSDQQYIREARFFQQGIDGLMQLSAVYVATLEMFGNTLFYPGMEFFFNPYGLGGGTDFGSPTTAGSVANKLGIGGYHTITSVRSSITPGSFKTTVAGQQYYSGDGSGNPNLRGKGTQNSETESLDAYVPEKLDEDACESVILDVQRFEPDGLESRPADDIEDNGVDKEEADFRELNESPTSTEEIDPFGESDNSEDRFGESENTEDGFGTSEQE